MQNSDTPTKVPLPFANTGNKNTIPTASQIGGTPGAASLQDGFPPATMTPIASGGVPPAGKDFNGIFNLLSQTTRWSQSGGGFVYDAAFATAIGGYPKGAVILKNTLDGSWLNTVDGNTSNPDTGGSGWVNNNALRTARITASTTFTVPVGVYLLAISGCAGGGGGGGGGSNNLGDASSTGGGGGGAGQSLPKTNYAVTPGQILTVTIGAAGIGGAGGTQGNSNAGQGGNGGNTSIAGLVTLTGGGGGGSGIPGAASGALAGSPGGGGYPSGSFSPDGVNTGANQGYSGGGAAGGSSPFGGGGGTMRGAKAASGGLPGLAAGGYGAGGGGGGPVYGTGGAGGAGANGTGGIIIIEW